MTGLETPDCVIIEEDEVVLPASNPPKLEIDKSVRSGYPSTCTEDPKAPLPHKVAEADLPVPNKVPKRPTATVITAAGAHSCDLRVAAREEQHGKPQVHHTTSYPSCSPCNVGCMGFKEQGPGAKGLWPLLTQWQDHKVVTSVSRFEEVSNIGFITVQGLNEGHIAPYTDIEFRLTKY